MTHALRALFSLDPDLTFLNHGSFGACPRAVQAEQSRLRALLEHSPVAFFDRELEPRLDAARRVLADFVHADTEDLVFVTNATAGVNAVLRSLRFAAGDELLTTDHTYNACKNALDWVAERSGARVVVARVPFPLDGPDDVTHAILAAVTPRTRLALIDHVTSPTALVFPVARICAELQARGIDVLIDGAHAPGMLPLDLAALGAAYYVGNCHKWLCAPKGAGFLVARRDRQADLVPMVISHGLNLVRARPRFHLLFDWIGTQDPTPWLCVPMAIAHLEASFPGGWPAIMTHNHALAVAARRTLMDTLGVAPPCPDAMLGSIASLPLPDGDAVGANRHLFTKERIEVPVFPWPAPPHRMIRVSAQIYNEPADYERLAAVVSGI